MLPAIGVVCIALFPFEREITPAWAFDVVDGNNAPLSGCRMEQHLEWQAGAFSSARPLTLRLARIPH